MEGLSIEEKAKAYDKAIERAKSLLSGNQLGNAWIYKLLPELKESEDEKIRKELITHCRNTRCVTEEGAERIVKWISWLEKQGEKTSDKIAEKAGTEKQRVLLTETDGSANIDWDCRSLDDVKILLKCGLEFIRTIEANKQILTDNRFGGCSFRVPTRYDKGIKQGEQKPVFEMKTPEESLGIDSDTYNKIVDECVYGEQKPIKEHNACEFCEDRYGCVSPCSMKLIEDQKPAWSEEDRDILFRTIDNLKFLRDTISIDPKYAINIIDIEREITWLNSLRPQNKTYYWTENEIKFAISDFIRGAESYEKMVEKLRCLKPQTTWKPSGEQMLAINTAINVLGKGTINGKYLIELHEQLKKLREE